MEIVRLPLFCCPFLGLFAIIVVYHNRFVRFLWIFVHKKIVAVLLLDSATGLLRKFELARADAGNDSTVDEQVGSGDETCMLAQQEGCCIGNLVAGSYTLGG